jgi:hypothetical protein
MVPAPICAQRSLQKRCITLSARSEKRHEGEGFRATLWHGLPTSISGRKNSNRGICAVCFIYGILVLVQHRNCISLVSFHEFLPHIYNVVSQKKKPSFPSADKTLWKRMSTTSSLFVRHIRLVRGQETAKYPGNLFEWAVHRLLRKMGLHLVP